MRITPTLGAALYVAVIMGGGFAFALAMKWLVALPDLSASGVVVLGTLLVSTGLGGAMVIHLLLTVLAELRAAQARHRPVAR